MLKTRQVYTPQAIINGTHVISGNDRQGILRMMELALQSPQDLTLTVNARRLLTQSGQVHVEYAVDKMPPGAFLNAALVQRTVVTRVPRGENAGRTLVQANVVRGFRSVPLEKAAGSVTTGYASGCV